MVDHPQFMVAISSGTIFALLWMVVLHRRQDRQIRDEIYLRRVKDICEFEYGTEDQDECVQWYLDHRE